MEVLMRSLPCPTELTVPIHPEKGDVDEHRNLDCANYGACLDRAVRQEWKSWSCARCCFLVGSPAKQIVFREMGHST